MFWVFFILHFLLYPASNGYNSYFDKDEKSIGGLKNPPPVNAGLYYLALVLDGVAVVLGYVKLNMTFAIMLLLYGLVSKAYSHPLIRLKKYPVAGWVITGLFQGLFTFLMCYVGINNFSVENGLRLPVILPGLLTTLMLWGNYPMTQIYQHEEDGKRGDKTFSMLLGIRGTFYFVACVFGLATLGFFLYFWTYFTLQYSLIYIASLLPVAIYFLFWFINILRDESKADHTHTMRLNFISATCLNGFFIYLFLDSSHVLQTF